MTRRPKGLLLTPTQQAVIKLLVQGMTNKQIALHLDTTEGAIKAHLHSIYTQCGITRGRVELVARFYRSEINLNINTKESSKCQPKPK